MKVFRPLLCLLLISTFLSAWAEDAAPEQTLEINNKWNLSISNLREFSGINGQRFVWVAIRKVKNHWEIARIYGTRPDIRKDSNVELFAATYDLQHWTNAHADMRTDCDDFVTQENEFQSVCTSVFAEKKTGMATRRIIFGNGGLTPYGYTDIKVQAAINSIRPEQAEEVLTAFENGTLR